MTLQNLKSVLGHTNWTTLRDQKIALCQVIDTVEGTVPACDNPLQNLDWIDVEALNGLLHWIEVLQFAAKDNGYPVVWNYDGVDGDDEDDDYIDAPAA